MKVKELFESDQKFGAHDITFQFVEMMAETLPYEMMAAYRQTDGLSVHSGIADSAYGDAFADLVHDMSYDMSKKEFLDYWEAKFRYVTEQLEVKLAAEMPQKFYKPIRDFYTAASPWWKKVSDAREEFDVNELHPDLAREYPPIPPRAAAAWKRINILQLPEGCIVKGLNEDEDFGNYDQMLFCTSDKPTGTTSWGKPISEDEPIGSSSWDKPIGETAARENHSRILEHLAKTLGLEYLFESIPGASKKGIRPPLYKFVKAQLPELTTELLLKLGNIE